MFTRYDKLLILLLLPLILLSFFISGYFLKEAKDSTCEVVITSASGKKIFYSLAEGERKEIELEGALGKCVVEVNGKRVRMVDAPCPNKLCIKSGWIDKPGSCVVCLPNKVVIEVKGSNEKTDAVSR